MGVIYILWHHLCEYCHRDICDEIRKYEIAAKTRTCLNGPFWAKQIIPPLRFEKLFKSKNKV